MFSLIEIGCVALFYMRVLLTTGSILRACFHICKRWSTGVTKAFQGHGLGQFASGTGAGEVGAHPRGFEVELRPIGSQGLIGIETQRVCAAHPQPSEGQ